MFSKDAVRRVSIERCQSRIEAEPRAAIGAEDRVRLSHIDVDVRVVVRWGHADALELLHPDADFWDTAVVPELGIAAAGHRLIAVVIGGGLHSPAAKVTGQSWVP
jgi:hypothetical protein